MLIRLLSFPAANNYIYHNSFFGCHFLGSEYAEMRATEDISRSSVAFYHESWSVIMDACKMRRRSQQVILIIFELNKMLIMFGT